tara:strand:+ start:153 stop:383 length:231 start_codon:yes stop_codon:yes gene_type:complete
MRQAGMKPKSHSSGTYWVRANAKNGGGKAESKPAGPAFDFDHDGKFTLWDLVGWLIVAFGVVAWFVFLTIIGGGIT